MKLFSSLSSSPAVMMATTTLVAVAVVSSSVVHCTEARAQADTDGAVLPHPDGGHQGPAPPAPQGGPPQRPQPPCCVRPGANTQTRVPTRASNDGAAKRISGRAEGASRRGLLVGASRSHHQAGCPRKAAGTPSSSCR
ncbi:hypothetical protein PVAP13_5NG142081 [Panicum virgatum]|uniref:Secreted protein n=1 Tax=Panicum virgatum TaxID=38727 RepID=A0A8T0RM99_PANVG|nr:hypothetical protein PVAP13_5NG142081 [Panicum virgatum]